MIRNPDGLFWNKVAREVWLNMMTLGIPLNPLTWIYFYPPLIVDTMGLFMFMWLDGNWNNYGNSVFMIAQDWNMQGLYAYYNMFNLGGFCVMYLEMIWTAICWIIFPIGWL